MEKDKRLSQYKKITKINKYEDLDLGVTFNAIMIDSSMFELIKVNEKENEER